MSMVEQVTPEKQHTAMDSESPPIAPNAPSKRKADGARDLFEPIVPTRSIKEILKYEANKIPKMQKENATLVQNNEDDAGPLEASIYARILQTENELGLQRADRAMKQMLLLGKKLSPEEENEIAGSIDGFEL